MSTGGLTPQPRERQRVAAEAAEARRAAADEERLFRQSGLTREQWNANEAVQSTTGVGQNADMARYAEIDRANQSDGGEWRDSLSPEDQAANATREAWSNQKSQGKVDPKLWADAMRLNPNHQEDFYKLWNEDRLLQQKQSNDKRTEWGIGKYGADVWNTMPGGANPIAGKPSTPGVGQWNPSQLNPAGAAGLGGWNSATTSWADYFNSQSAHAQSTARPQDRPTAASPATNPLLPPQAGANIGTTAPTPLASPFSLKPKQKDVGYFGLPKYG